jgi:hypothetical protein
LLVSLNGPLDGMPRDHAPGKLVPASELGRLKFVPHPFHDRGSGLLFLAFADESEQVQMHAVMIAESGYHLVGLAEDPANIGFAQTLRELADHPFGPAP